MEESLEDLIHRVLAMNGPTPRTLINVHLFADLVKELEARDRNHTRLALEDENVKITFTLEQLAAMTDFSGQKLDLDSLDELELGIEFTLESKAQITYDDNGTGPDYEGLAIHVTEYPEEGSMPLCKE